MKKHAAATDSDAKKKNVAAFFDKLDAVAVNDVRGYKEEHFSGYYAVQFKQQFEGRKAFHEWFTGTSMPAIRDAWLASSPESNVASASRLSDEEIIKGLKFFKPEPAPPETRDKVMIKGYIGMECRVPPGGIIGKLSIEMRMLFKSKEKGWVVIPCSTKFDITDRATASNGFNKDEKIAKISFPQHNKDIESKVGDRNAIPVDCYTVIRYQGTPVFETTPKSDSTVPKDWWKKAK